MTFHIEGLTNLLLLAPVPFLAVCVTYMIVGLFVGLFNGPRTVAFRLVLPWAWLWLTLPTLLAGLWGIVRVLAGLS